MAGEVRHGCDLISEYDVFLFKQGEHSELYRKLGSRPLKMEGEEGTYFAVWAPNAIRVTVTGDFNGWDHASHPLAPRWDESGIWEGFIPGVEAGARYK
ncbi:MAG: hypothetical protein RQ758_08710, partial [Methanomicrobiaceae archaeon]|nr:hypothetical protein [Methanomicrobiaceae archaeon]